MIPPRLRLPLSSLAAFALGVGLTAAWFQRGDSAPPEEPAIPQGRQSEGEAAHGKSAPRPTPWKPKSAPPDSRSAAEGTTANLPEEEENIRRGLRAQFRHEARIDAHTIAARLGLDPGQTEEFLAARLEDAETRFEALDPKPGSDAWWLGTKGDTWLALNLTTEQKLAYETCQRDLHREEADRHALAETSMIARVVELTEEQRAALQRKFAESYIPIELPDCVEFLTYGEPINVEATDSADAPTNVVITESRIEMPVFTGRQPWLSEILTAGQLATYRAFQEKQRELERLNGEEMRVAEEE